MGNIEKIRQLLRVVEPEKMRKGSRHEHLEREKIALTELMMKEHKKRLLSRLPESSEQFAWLNRTHREL